MSLPRRHAAALALLIGVCLAGPVAAETIKDATRIATVRPSTGFVDTPLAVNATGKRLAYVTTNAADRSQLHIFDLDRGAAVTSFGIESLKATPVAVAFVGDNLFVVGQEARGTERGIVFDATGKVLHRIGRADRVRPTTYKGRQVASLYRSRATKRGTTHLVEAVDLLTGKRVGKRGRLDVDAKGLDKRRNFVLNHWESERLVAVGTAVGTYDRKADQRMPDQAGRFDLLAGKLAERAPIKDLYAQRRYLADFASRADDERFVALSRDRRALSRYDSRALAPTPVSLASPFGHYNPRSLRSRRGPGDSVFFTITIDPVHPEAAAAKRAVPEWLDVYELPAGATKAVRRARFLVEEERDWRWVATSRHLVVVPAHVGFSRGGPALSVYRFDTGATPATSKK